MQIPAQNALQKLREEHKLFAPLFQHGSLLVEVYKPHGQDHQTPHTRDEIYVVISGTGNFYLQGKIQTFQPGDFIFVPAFAEHRFQDFTDDFATWVFFFGPEGGEKEEA
ncbi:Cupin domain-containing protein [Chitinophaga skermanii]|uniref:Cupin domain-containing protein n=1 Tax=Chitinophaga skermanii TaxID=331697 RepID=A0A327R3T2_9BACT|nr:cupin domain-containing protein [Chitinophaga skermanii]RAJ08537.1 Cupin domain-containing protein [Chitinophaga skermanii]